MTRSNATILARAGVCAAACVVLAACSEQEQAAPQSPLDQAQAEDQAQFQDQTRTEQADADTMPAVAIEFVGPDGTKIGDGEVQATAAGVEITVTVNGLEHGPHAFHIHETGICEPPDFTSAGGHFDPFGAPHGPPTAGRSERHAGDMPNENAGREGTLKAIVTNELVTLIEGESRLHDPDGSAIVIHAGADDEHSQPAGAAGARVACAVVFPPRETG